ncbi:FecR domain-containing protein [Patescibacteria group bacterium]
MSKGKVYAEKILSERITELSEEVSLDAHQKMVIKERVFSSIEEKVNQGWAWANPFLSFSKKLLSGVLMFLIMFGAYTYLNVDTQVVRAHNFTKLDSFAGDLKIYRDGDPIAVFIGMEIKEKDRVITGKNAIAVIEYHDDSITRLSENTEIIINELDIDREDVTRTYVEIDVVEGNVWSKVVNLVDDDSAFVVLAEDISTEATQAAFNVAVEDHEVEVEVFDHTVEIKTKNSDIKRAPKLIVLADETTEEEVEKEFEVKQEKKKKSRLYSGDKAVFKEGKEFVAVADIEEEKEETDDWVKSNIKEDIVYIEKVERRIIAEKSEIIGVEEADEPVSYSPSIREESRLLLTFDDVEELKIELDLAEKKFIAAELKLEEDFITSDEIMEAETDLLKFAEVVMQFYEEIEEVKTVDELYAVELRDYLNKKLKLMKKDLATLLPGSRAYLAKEIVEQLHFLAAETKEELAEMKYNQALAKLAEIETLIKEGDEELAITIAEDYEEDISEVKEIIVQLENVDEYSDAAPVTNSVTSDDDYEIVIDSNIAPIIETNLDAIMDDDKILEEDIEELEEQVHDIILELERTNPELNDYDIPSRMDDYNF